MLRVTSALVAMPLFVVGGLGFRLLALPGLYRALRRCPREEAIWRVLAWTTAAAMTVPFVIATVPPNETLHFYQFALFLLPLFVARAVVRGSTFKDLVASMAVVAIAVPSTLHYLERKWTDERRPFAQLRTAERPVVELLHREDPRRTWILHNRPRRSTLVGVAAARRSVLSWSDYVPGGAQQWVRIERFFQPVEESPAKAFDLLAQYRPTHVLEYPKADRIHPGVRASLNRVFENDEVVLYTVPPVLWRPTPVTGCAEQLSAVCR